MKLSAKEELVVELFRGLTGEQRTELLKGLRALLEANQIVQDKLTSPLAVVGNVRIEAKYGLPRPRGTDRRKRTENDKPKPRRPDRGQDDAEGVE